MAHCLFIETTRQSQTQVSNKMQSLTIGFDALTFKVLNCPQLNIAGITYNGAFLDIIFLNAIQTGTFWFPGIIHALDKNINLFILLSF